jgi:hypothetical protein
MVAEARLSTGSMALRKMSSMELLVASLGMRFSFERRGEGAKED